MSRRRKSSVRIVSEADLVRELAKVLSRDGYRVRSEVSNMGQSADMVATRGRWVTIIEAKMRDWRRALKQCQGHEQVADFVCVAIASARVANELLHAASARGYGVIHYDGKEHKFGWTLRPRLNRLVWTPQRRYWAQKMKGVALCQ